MTSKRTIKVGAVAAALALFGCDGWTEFRRGQRIDDSAAPINTILETEVKLPNVRLGKEGTSSSLRIVLAPDGLHVDNTAWLSGLNGAGHPALRELDAAGVERLVVAVHGIPIGDGAPNSPIPALREVIERAIEVEKETVQNPSGDVEIFLGKDTPVSQVSRIFSTLYETSLLRFEIAANVSDEPGYPLLGFVRLDTPRRCTPSPDAPCAVPTIEVTPDGLMVRAHTAPLKAGTCHAEVAALLSRPAVTTPIEHPPEGQEPKPTTAATWNGRVMLGPVACPSIPKLKGHHDVHELARLLADIADMAPGCDTGALVAPAATPWSEVAPLLAVMKTHSAFVRPVLLSTDAAPEVSCKGGLKPGALPEVAARRKENKRTVDRLSIMGHLDDEDGEGEGEE